MNSELHMHELDDEAIEGVAGGVLPVGWAIGFGLAAVFGGGFTAGAIFGTNLANRKYR